MPSTCIFGSTARNTSDLYSDRDILVVAPTEHEIEAASRYWISAGWSVATFTNEQIAGMANRGSLFLQHLKQEGVIVQDDDFFLADLIGRYVPKDDYEDQLAESFGLLRDVTSHTFDYWPMMCSADIAYGSIRNIAIGRLAAKGIYLFDYADLIRQLARHHVLARHQIDALLELRLLKHSYRARHTLTVSSDVLEIALQAANAVFRYPQTPARDEPSSARGYRGLRLLELNLVGRVDPRHLDKLPPAGALGKVWAFIRDPRGYRDTPPRIDSGWLRRASAMVNDSLTAKAA